MKIFSRCAICKKTNIEVRLYRPYGNFYREEDNFCNEHVASRSWYIPLIFDLDGSVWGYTSAPREARERFYTLPEASLTAPAWSESSVPGTSHWVTPNQLKVG